MTSFGWFSVDIDILKPNTGYMTVERPVSSKGTPEGQSSGTMTPPQVYPEPVSEGEEDEAMDLAPAKDEDRRTGLSPQAVADAIAFREKSLKERDAGGWQGPGSPVHREAASYDIEEEEREQTDERMPFLQVQRKSGTVTSSHPYATLSIDPLAPSSTFDKALRERLKDAETARNGGAVEEPTEARGLVEDEVREEDRLLVRDWIAPSGKKIAVPVRIEPKVYFANERTFLVSHGELHVRARYR